MQEIADRSSRFASGAGAASAPPASESPASEPPEPDPPEPEFAGFLSMAQPRVVLPAASKEIHKIVLIFFKGLLRYSSGTRRFFLRQQKASATNRSLVCTSGNGKICLSSNAKRRISSPSGVPTMSCSNARLHGARVPPTNLPQISSLSSIALASPLNTQ